MAYASPIVSRGGFKADGNAKEIRINGEFDRIVVFNQTAAEQDSADLGYRFIWSRDMNAVNPLAGRGFVEVKLGSENLDPTTVEQIAAGKGFEIIDYNESRLGSPVTVDTSGAGSNTTQPVYLTSSTTGLVNGSIVRLTNMTGQNNISGMDFAINTIVASTSFKIAAPLATAPDANCTGGKYRIVKRNPEFYPAFRYIVKVAKSGTNIVVTTSVPSGYKVGQDVVFNIPQQKVSGTAIYGMTELDGLVGTITAKDDSVGTQTITVDIDATSFTAFTFPTATQAVNAIRRATVSPVGMDTGYARANDKPDDSDAVTNQAYYGVKLPAGTKAPAGQADDMIEWIAVRANYSSVDYS